MASIIERANEEKAKKILQSGRTDPASTVTAAIGNEADFKKVAMNTGADIASNSAQQGDTLGTAGGGLMMAGASTANPYLMAGGLGLTVLGAGEANKRKEKEAQRQAYNERIKARQQALNNIANIRLD